MHAVILLTVDPRMSVTECEGKMHPIGRMLGGAVALSVLASGCSGPSEDFSAQGLDIAIVPFTEPDVVNPLRGQFENLTIGLFPQENPAQREYPAWPSSGDGSMRISWRELQPMDPRQMPNDSSDDRKYDFSKIDANLARYADKGGRLTLRVYSYNSCCNDHYPDNTNIAIPDWLESISGTTTNFNHDGTVQVVPDWNNKDYLDYFQQLLAALGRRYNRDERLSIFEFSGYGDFSENHIAYLRDELQAPGPSLDESERELGYLSQFKDQSISRDSIRHLVQANLDAFPDTQIVTAPGNPEIVKQLFADSVQSEDKPVGIRADCLGVFSPLPAWADEVESVYVKAADPVVSLLEERFSTAPVVTEWCQLPVGMDKRSYYEKGLRDTANFHVSMTASVGFPDQDAEEPMEPALFALWSRTNKFAGYRYTVAVASRPRTDSERNSEWFDVDWANLGAGPALEDWKIEYEVADASGNVVQRAGSGITLKSLVVDQALGAIDDQPVPATADETVRIDRSGLQPGLYTVTAGVVWKEHKSNATHSVTFPPMALAQGGRDGTGRYPIATFSIP